MGPLELLVVSLIALIALAPKRLPEVGRSIGTGRREFRRSLRGEEGDRRHSELAGEEASLSAPEGPLEGEVVLEKRL